MSRQATAAEIGVSHIRVKRSFADAFCARNKGVTIVKPGVGGAEQHMMDARLDCVHIGGWMSQEARDEITAHRETFIDGYRRALYAVSGDWAKSA